MAAEDIAAGMRLCRASNWNQLEDDWRVFLNTSGSGGFLAGKAGNEGEDRRVVGTVTFLRYDSFAWIAMMLVDPQERGAGIGARLMAEALSALKDVDCVGLDATPMGEPLYRRFGFLNDFALVRTKAVVDAATVELARPQSPSTVVREMRREDLSDVLRRDREVFGADRGELLASLLARAPECAWIAKDGAAVCGYTFGRPGWLYHQVGPVVAEDSATARALVARCLSELNGKRVAIDAPRLDGEWLNWLESIGFVVERPFVRMFRYSNAPHPHAHPGVPARQYAIAGPEFG
jgi:GNAT superfamily N-acetyltransferase